ncbi:MAG: glycosyltransferase, partial [Actinobacteria bacterium]|nr:glycosyltransferase [Actinomycetota bacterium]
MKITVIIPTYNEIENIDSMLRAVRSAVPDAELLVVDDNSPDGTG